MKKFIYSFIIAAGLPFLGFSQPSNYVLLDGTESILVSNSSDINLGTFRDRTVEFWFKADDVSHSNREVIFEEGANVRGINFWVEDGYIYLGMYNDSKDGPSDVDEWFGTWFRAPISSGQWYHVALVLNDADNTGYPSTLNEKLEWYLGGVLQDTGHGGPLYSHSGDIRISSTDIGVFPSTPAVWSNDVYEATASGHNEDVTTSHFNGAVGLLRIWNSARTETQIIDNKNALITSVGTDGLVAYLNGDLVTDTGGDSGSDGEVMPPAFSSSLTYDNNDGDGLWNNPLNWKDDSNIRGVLPTNGDELTIKSGTGEVIIPDGIYYFKKIIIEADPTLTVNSDVYLNVDRILNKGELNLNTSSSNIIDFENKGELNINGHIYTQTDFLNEGTGVAELLTSGELEVDGNFDNDGDFTIKSDASGTGSLITNGTINNTGTMTVERWIDAGGSKWQLVSSPMDAETSEIFYGHYLNSYDEANGDFNAEKSKDIVLETGEGYVVKWKDEFAAGSNPLVFNLDKPFTGDKDLVLNSYTGGDAESNTNFHLPLGFNLVGNPYPSNLSMVDVWDYNDGHASGNDIDATFYYYQESGGWQVYNASTNTPAINKFVNMGQGFGVVLSGNNSSGGTLHIPNSARSHEVGNGFNKRSEVPSTNNHFELNSDTGYEYSKIYFRFNENSTSAYDGLFDSYKINSFDKSPNSYFVSSDYKKLAICEMPESESVDLGFNMATSGDVTFSLSNIKDFTEIILEDKQEGTFTDLLKSDYTFYYSDEDAETGRFTIHFNQETLSEVEELTGLKIYSNTSSVILNSNESLNNVELELYNITGQKVLSKHFNTLKQEEINTGLNGVYILKLTSDNGVYTSKLILN